MKVLLINPNRYRTPPVPPIGLEYLACALRHTDHECRILDLCFSDNPFDDIDRAIDDFSPDVTGMTIRNIDTVIYDNNVFFLDEIRSFVSHVKNRDIPVFLGGAGFSFIPEGILDYTGADWGIKGPGENAILYLLDRMKTQRNLMMGFYDGWKYVFDPDLEISHGNGIDYARYVAEGGIAGFQTQKGCREHCSYCNEGSGFVRFRNPAAVVRELNDLAGMGFTTFHLCDTEFNQDLSFCKSFLAELIEHGQSIEWALYMKASPYDDELFQMLRKSGANLVTLSLPTGKDSIGHAENISRLAKKHGIRFAIDLLTGFPDDTMSSVKKTIERLRKTTADTIGINSTIRLYSGCTVTHTILDSGENTHYLLGDITDNPDFVRPAFFRKITVDMLREIIGDDPRFRIEGFERTSNYQRLDG